MSYTLPSESLITGGSNKKYSKIGEWLIIIDEGRGVKGGKASFPYFKKAVNLLAPK